MNDDSRKGGEETKYSKGPHNWACAFLFAWFVIGFLCLGIAIWVKFLRI